MVIFKIRPALRLRALMLAGATAVLATVPALAQEANPPTADANSDGVEIVVTAQKREQSLQEVPVSVAVISAEALLNNRISSVEELQVLSPSLSFTNSANTRGQGLQIRGIGTLSFSDGVEPSVSTVIDGVVIGRQAQSVFDFIDIERIEVLRGPQGTLFGKNASAGAINIVTSRPSLTKTEVVASASYATLNELKLRGSASVPLVDGVLGARLTGYTVKRDGPINNVFNGEDYNNQDQWGLRGKLLFEPSDSFSLLVIGDYAKIDRDCCVSTARTVLLPSRRALLGPQIVPGPENRQINIDAPFFFRQESYGGSAEANIKLGNHTLTSITAYREFKLDDNNDGDNLPINNLNLNSAVQKQTQFTQEIRLTSPAGNRFEYVLGGFFFNQTVGTTTQVAGTFGAVPAGSFLGSQVERSVDTRNRALFADATFRVADTVRLIGGARYVHEEITGRFVRFTLPGAVGASPISGPPIVVPRLESSDDDLSYRFGAQFDVNDDVMAYATFSRGYKGAALNMLNNLNAATVNSGQAVLDPETAKNFELGLRSTWLDRRLLLNVTLFNTDFTNFQAQTFNPQLLAFALDNAGKLRTRGVELEALYKPMQGLNLSANLAYTDAKIRDFKFNCYPGQTAAQGCVDIDGSGPATALGQDLAGKPIANAPEWAFNLSGSYETPLGFVAMNGFVNATYSYRSSVNFGFNQDPNTVQNGYGLFNASIGVATADDRIRVSVFAKNLFDTNFATFIAGTGFDSTATASGYSQTLTEAAQRIVGIALDARF